MEKEKVKRTERGWGGHFCCASRCLFRRNTLLEYGEEKLVVSTVGAMIDLREDPYLGGKCFEPINNSNRHYETVVFFSDLNDKRYYDIAVSLGEIPLRGERAIDTIDADDRANLMHEAAVNEMTFRLETNDIPKRNENR